MDHPEPLPYWLVNVPPDARPDTCPEFLRTVNEKDRGILSTPDSEYRRLTWAEVKEIIRTNRIDLFRRVPSDLRRYLGYTAKLKKDYGSVMNFVMEKRLKWDDLTPRGAPFTESADMKTLFNDWPYGIDEKVTHLVVWTKFILEVDPVTDDLTPSARKEIDDYVVATFHPHLPAENIIWFKNWSSLKSIHAVEHFHVMLFNPDPAFVKRITNNDVPLVDKVGVINEV